MNVVYRVYDITLASNFSLGDLLPTSTDPVDCSAVVSKPAPQLGSADWFHHWQFEGEDRPWCFIARRGNGEFLFRFPNLADFQVAVEPLRLECIPVPGVPDETIRHLLLDQVLPAALGHTGRCILHASGVIAPDGGVLAFAGPTGTGKSTLAAHLCREGCTLLTDDGLLLREHAGDVHCIPSYPGIRLWEDSISEFDSIPSQHNYAHYTSKSRLALQESGIAFQSCAAPLRRIYFMEAMEQEQQIVITPMQPREAFIHLVKSTFQIDVNDRTRLMTFFERFQSLTRRRMFYRLSYPHDWSRLSSLSKQLLAHAPEEQI
jgi:hypothetical protein